MKIYTTKQELSTHLAHLRKGNRSVGLVPTMGALHDGHLELIKTSLKACSNTVCSIFVNPTQFNDPADLQNYPRTAGEDIARLEQQGCDVLFMPPYEEVYGDNEHWNIDLGSIGNVLEGKFRPGHFQGVTQVVYKLFSIVEPTLAFFGQKDFQQFSVISKMAELMKVPVKLVMCPIVREESGLAMSSRNIRLSPNERREALALFNGLKLAAAGFKNKTLAAVKNEALQFFAHAAGVELEYFEICEPATLAPANEHSRHPIALVAAKVGSVRLIDNMFLS